jgi:hypothetical protein
MESGKQGFGLVLAIACVLVACATPPSKIEPSPVDAQMYESFPCASLRIQAESYDSRIAQDRARLEEVCKHQSGWLGVASWLIFWPELLYPAPEVNKQQAQDFARLLGEYNAIHEAAIRKRCPDAELNWPGKPTAPPPSSSAPH